MKDLTYQELLKAPKEVQYLYVMSLNKRPVSHSSCQSAMANHPEYFQEEIEWKMKWNKIPKEVHEAYRQEIEALTREMLPSSGKGLRYYLLNQDKVDREYEAVKDELERKQGEIWAKHYAEFGLKSKL